MWSQVYMKKDLQCRLFKVLYPCLNLLESLQQIKLRRLNRVFTYLPLNLLSHNVKEQTSYSQHLSEISPRMRCAGERVHRSLSGQCSYRTVSQTMKEKNQESLLKNNKIIIIMSKFAEQRNKCVFSDSSLIITEKKIFFHS